MTRIRVAVVFAVTRVVARTPIAPILVARFVCYPKVVGKACPTAAFRDDVVYVGFLVVEQVSLSDLLCADGATVSLILP